MSGAVEEEEEEEGATTGLLAMPARLPPQLSPAIVDDDVPTSRNCTKVPLILARQAQATL